MKNLKKIEDTEVNNFGEAEWKVWQAFQRGMMPTFGFTSAPWPNIFDEEEQDER